jgi:CIC family chloride channel protein
LTLGSGASGGIFSPSLFLGATLGAAYGSAIHWLFPGVAINIPAFAIAGMAGVVGGATGAAMTAIVMLFEMTLDYNAILPATITVAISYGLRKSLLRDSIYTLKLIRRGHYMPQALQTNLHFLRPAREIMDTSFGTVQAVDLVRECGPELLRERDTSLFLVLDNGNIAGFITRGSILEATCNQAGEKTMGQIAIGEYVTVSCQTSILDILAKTRMAGASVAFVVHEGSEFAAANIEGVVTKQKIADSLADVTELFTG